VKEEVVEEEKEESIEATEEKEEEIIAEADEGEMLVLRSLVTEHSVDVSATHLASVLVVCLSKKTTH